MKAIRFKPETQAIRALLEGQKTEARFPALRGDELRVFVSSNYPEGWWFKGRVYTTFNSALNSRQGVLSMCKYRAGDKLYVQEAFSDTHPNTDGASLIYRADVPDANAAKSIEPAVKWRPSVQMTKEHSRIFLSVTSLSIIRLHDSFYAPCISPAANLAAEGVDIGETCRSCLDNYEPCCTHQSNEDNECSNLDAIRSEYAEAWDASIPADKQGVYGWLQNPWVWVLKFRRISREQAESDWPQSETVQNCPTNP